MTYSVAFGASQKKFPTLRAVARWVIEVKSKNKAFRFKILCNGEPLDAVDEEVVALYFTKLKKDNENGF